MSNLYTNMLVWNWTMKRYEHASLSSNWIKLVSDDLYKRICDSTVNFDLIKDINDKFLAKEYSLDIDNDYITYQVKDEGRAYHPKGQGILDRRIAGLNSSRTVVHDTNKFLLKVLECNSTVIDKGFLSAGDYYYVITSSLNMINNKHMTQNVCFYYGKVFMGTKCDVCGAIIDGASESLHKMHPECKIIRDHGLALSDNLCPVYGIQDIVAIKEACLDIREVPKMYQYYTQEWVSKAIDTYRKNNGYADMTLSEYLLAIKPNNE